MSKDIELSGVTAHLVKEGNFREWIGTIKGPEDSPYQGGYFDVEISIPAAYPFEPPKCRLITKAWHPNISSVTGAICLDILKDAWSPALTVKTALLSIQALLSSAEPNDPQDGEVAKQYLSNRAAFDAKAKSWTEHHAMPAKAGEKEDRLTQMGFSLADVKKALAESNGDEEAAVEKLLSAF